MVLPFVVAFSFPELVAALALLLVLWATVNLLARPIGYLLGNVPFIGGSLAGAFTGAISAVTNWALGWAKIGIDAIVGIVSAPIHWVAQAISWATSTLGYIAVAFEHLGDSLVATALELAHWVGILTGNIALVAYHLAVEVGRVPGIAADIARSIVGAAVAALDVTIAALRSFVTAGLTAEHALIVKVNGDLVALIAGQVHVLSQSIAATAAAIRTEVATDVRTIDGQVGTIARDLAPILPLALPLAWPLLLTRIDTMQRECVDPVCGVIGPAIPSLNALSELATLLAVGALAGDAIRDPQGAARATANAAGAVHDLAAGLAREFAGVSL